MKAFFVAVPISLQANKMNLDRFFRCAHRGASGHAPENTLAAIRLAIEMGAEMCELDVQQTADDRLVVMHDDTLDRTTNGKGNVSEMTLAELQQYDAGSWFDPRFAGEKLPALEEVVALVRGRMQLNIEAKIHGHERNVPSLIVETLRRERFDDECVVTSFDHKVVDEIKILAPELKVGYIFGWREFYAGVFARKVELLSTHFSLVDTTFLKRTRAASKKVHVWTVNGQWHMRRMIEMGVDGILTNYPDRLNAINKG
ncbi:MAG: glycerophosphodiester phosphodiesterase [bacterium]